ELFDGGVSARRCRGTGPALAATAMAGAGTQQLGGHLVSHRAAVAATGDRKRRHGSIVAYRPRRTTTRHRRAAGRNARRVACLLTGGALRSHARAGTVRLVASALALSGGRGSR